MTEYVLRSRNGANYYELLKTPCTWHVSTAIVDETQKLVYPDSTFTIDAVTHSYKYGSELQFKSYTFEPPTLEQRVDKDHNIYRLECGYLPLTHETAEKLRDVADSVDSIIGYIKTTKQSRRKIEKLEDLLL